MRLGGPVFLKTTDPIELALQHQKTGYRAAYCPENIGVHDTAQIQAYRRAFKEKDVVFAEVGAWCNPLDGNEDVARKNIAYLVERLALAEELGALCCVNIAGSRSTDSWYGPHALNYAKETVEKTVAIARSIIDSVNPRTAKFTLEMMPYNFLDGPSAYLDLMRAIDRPQFGVHLDPVNCIVSPKAYYGNVDLLRECFRLLGPHIVSCHAKDVRIRPEPFSVQFDEVCPGRGVLDYGEFLRGLDSLDQDTPLMMEHLSTEEEYREAQSFIETAAARMGVACGRNRDIGFKRAGRPPARCSNMTSRERMQAAINRKPVDRVPTDIWATSEVWEHLRLHFGEGVDIMAQLHIDGMNSVWPDYVGPPLPAAPEGEHIDLWGMRTRRVTHPGGTYDEQFSYPLAAAVTIDDLDKYQWPSTAWFDYSVMRPRAEEARKARVLQCGYMAPFYYHNLLRGLEQSLIDPLLDPEFTHAVIGRISGFFYEHHRRMFEACEGLIDVAQVTDDLGSQTGPLISPELYREFYAPQHKRFIDLCHEFGIKVFHHDDGSCRPFLPLLVDMGIDILNPVQWTCPGMDMRELKAEFGSRVCFHGAIENQSILPFGTPEDVCREVRHCIDALAGDGTGYILASCHNLQGNTPVENIIAMYDEAWRYGERD